MKHKNTLFRWIDPHFHRLQYFHGMNAALFTSVTDAHIPVQHACEVGVYLPDTSNVLGWIEAGVRTTLVECDPLIVSTLRERFAASSNITIHDVAVAEEAGTLTLYRTGASTFGGNVTASPALVNDGYVPSARDAFTVRSVRFDSIDDGTIDVLSIDIEGGEWNVVQYLKSRPAVISIETHGKHYTNPHRADIEAWMSDNGYGAWYMDASDTVYRKGWTQPVRDLRPPLSIVGKIKRNMRATSALGWVARMLSVASLSLLVLFLFGGKEHLQPTLRELSLMVFFPFGVMIGMIIGWIRPRIGGLIAVGALAGFYVVSYVIGTGVPTGPYFLLFALPGVLFVIDGILMRRSGHA